MKMYYLCVKKPFNITNYRGKERLWADGLQVKVATSDGEGEKKHCAMTASGRDGRRAACIRKGSWHGNVREKNRGQTDREASRSATT